MNNGKENKDIKKENDERKKKEKLKKQLQENLKRRKIMINEKNDDQK
jgi:hypothetical protein